MLSVEWASVRSLPPTRFKGGLKPALLFVALLALPGHGPAAHGASGPAIRWLDADAPTVAVEVSGVSVAASGALAAPGWSQEKWAEILGVFAEPGSGTVTSMPPMAGTWTLNGDRLRFAPIYPLQTGVRYRAEFRAGKLPGENGSGPVLTSFFELPASTRTPTTSVASVFPSADLLPENQLKFYIQFSAPMSRGGAYEHVQLRDTAGHEIELAFLELDEELWDPEMTRLTLLIDPGRIKRGVKPLEDVGPVFEEGKRYALTVAGAWRDAGGQPLRESYAKTFGIGAADRLPPDPARWTLQAAQSGTRDPLVVDFDEPMDRALAARLINVSGPTGAPVAGEASLGEQERRWSFVPAQPWQRGTHTLLVPTTIEDLAGNNIGKAFDVDLFAGVQRRITTESARRVFEVR